MKKLLLCLSFLLFGGHWGRNVRKRPVAVNDVGENAENVALHKIIVDEIHEPVGVVALFEKQARRRALFDKVDPASTPQVEALFGPVVLKHVRIDNCRLHDFLSGEHTPCQSSDAAIVVGARHTGAIHGVIGDCRTTSQLHFERSKMARRAQKLDVGLLVNVSSTRAPSVNAVVARETVDTRLRVNRQKTVTIQTLQRISNRTRLCLEGTFDPRERSDASLSMKKKKNTIKRKSTKREKGNLEKISKNVPKLLRQVRRTSCQTELGSRGSRGRRAVTTSMHAKSRRASIPPTSIREIVPLSSSRHITTRSKRGLKQSREKKNLFLRIWTVCPMNRTNALVASSLVAGKREIAMREHIIDQSQGVKHGRNTHLIFF